MMMGTRRKIGDGATLIFDVHGRTIGHVNKIRVTLNGRDLYDVEYWRIPGARGLAAGREPLKVATDSDIYADGLHAAIESATGLALSL